MSCSQANTQSVEEDETSRRLADVCVWLIANAIGVVRLSYYLVLLDSHYEPPY